MKLCIFANNVSLTVIISSLSQSSADRPTPPPPQTPLAKNTSVAAVAAAAAATTIANNNNNNTGQLGKKEKRLSTTRYNVTKNRELLPLPRLLGEYMDNIRRIFACVLFEQSQHNAAG